MLTLGSAAAIVAVSIRIPKTAGMLCLLGYKPTAMSIPPHWPHKLSRPRKSFLDKGIERIPCINKAGTTDGETSFHLTNSLGDHAVWLAGLKLALQLNKDVISAIDSVRQHCCNIKDRDRIVCEKGGRVGCVKLRGFHGTHIRRVRLI